jgi:hypothetical protein
MAPEYIKILYPEKVYGEKNLLFSQINLLEIHRILHQYKKIREEEFSLKIELKKEADALRNAVEALQKLMPKSTIHPISDEKEQVECKEEPEYQEELSLEEEIDSIKKKLASLQ